MLVGGLMMYIAWQHNPQGEFHGTNGVEWSAWLLVGASWFVPVTVAAAVVVGVVWTTANWIGLHCGGPNKAAARDGHHGAIQ